MNSGVQKHTISEEDIAGEISLIKEDGFTHDEALNYAESFSVGYDKAETKDRFIREINSIFDKG